MTNRTKLIAKGLAVIVLVAGISYLLLADGRSGAAVVENASRAALARQAQNPCNPCRKKAGQQAQNPCNPCAQKKKAQNPCNPCAGKAQNPCNPCGGKMKATGKVYQEAAQYKSWAKLTEPAVSVGHGGKYVVTYANSAAEATIRSGRFPFKTGAKFIKEGYEDAGGKPGELTTLYVMEKRGRDWYYAMTDTRGNIQMDGLSKKAQVCSRCHAGAKKTDYVFTAARLQGQTPSMPANPCNPCARKKKGQNP
jgi:hypothetical protein